MPLPVIKLVQKPFGLKTKKQYSGDFQIKLFLSDFHRIGTGNIGKLA